MRILLFWSVIFEITYGSGSSDSVNPSPLLLRMCPNCKQTPCDGSCRKNKHPLRFDVTMISGEPLRFDENPENVGELKQMIEKRKRIPADMIQIMDGVREMADDDEQLDPAIHHHLTVVPIPLSDPQNALYKYTREGRVTGVEYALQYGADINAQNELFRGTALMIAASTGHVDVLKILLKEGADKDKQDNSGWTALMIAAQNGDAGVVKLLLEGKADKDKQDRGGYTALMIAASTGHVDVLKLLLKADADKDKQNSVGDTALILAAQNVDAGVVKLLLEAKADKDKQDRYGYTALNYTGRDDIKDLLQ